MAVAEHIFFDPFSSELSEGTQLIEASAGTGKTYTLVMMVVRAIVELEIGIDRLLVVTFTVAATEELKVRIRTRLHECLSYLAAASTGGNTGSLAGCDPSLARWLDGLDDPHRAKKLIELALIDLDRAAIYTIHGFCRKTLSEYVLESDHFFDVELISDSSEYLLEIVRDYWRKRLYPPRIRYVPIITAVFASPQALYDSIAGAENRLDILIPEPWPFADAVTVLESSWDKLKTWWSSHGATLASRYSDLIEQGYCKVAAEREFAGRLEYCETAFTGDHLCEASRLSWLDGDSIIDAINANKVGGSSKKARVIESWVLPENLLTDYADACEKLILCMRLECADTVRRNLIPRLQAAGVLDFDGLITLFVEALASSSGARLTRLVGTRYKMALIDEFQDTDQSQWFIFSRLFSSPGNRLYLIGDPKQAIYRFRGADIEAYFQAKKSARSRSTLSANYRSHPALIAAVNRLFNAAWIGGETFMPVTAALSGSDGCLCAGDVDCSGIVYCQLAERREKDGTWSKGAADELIVGNISHEIARLIDVNGDMAVDEAQEGARRPVRPGDIAILVRTNDQAERYMAALRKATIPAIVTSKISVFASGECEALRAVAQAVLHPDEPLLLRSALALDWFGLSGDEHYRICSDSVRFGEIQRRFSGGRKRWLAAGFYAMLTGLISDEQIYEHLCKKPSVERRIANIEHLAQLIQQAETENHLTPLQTMQWLSNAAGRQAMAQETELHLESDREAVQILTLHSAKGLEFPIVFCPHLMHASSPAKKGMEPLRVHTDEGATGYDFGSDDFALRREEEINQQGEEDLRLAYVGVTRAQLRCYLFWADIKGRGSTPSSFDSPLGRLLFPQGDVSFNDQCHVLAEQTSTTGTQYRCIDPDEVFTHSPPAIAKSDQVLHRRQPGTRRLVTNRTRTSFTGLVRHTAAHGADEPGSFDETVSSSEPVEHGGLPPGVRFGNVFHEMLQKGNFADMAAGKIDKDLLAHVCRRYQLDIDVTSACQLIINTVSAELTTDPGATGFRLMDLPPEKTVKEMGFTLHLHSFNPDIFNACAAEVAVFRPIQHATIEGYLNGFIDLVAEHDGRFFIVDYKTNYLGTAPGDYSRNSIMETMRHHNYGLQYLLYTVVIHRYLSTFVPRYRYRTHFGGVLYPFVRGIDPRIPGHSIFADIPPESVITGLDHCLGRASHG
jgi:exodeoxyribonuclease V beta subunit